MKKEKINVCVVSSAPAPYRKGLFERLARREDLRIKVYFLGETCGVWNWDKEIGGDYPYEYLSLPFFLPKDKYSFWVHPQIPKVLKSGSFDVVVIGGYFIPSFLIAIMWCIHKGVPYVLWSESHGEMRRSIWRKAVRPLIVERIVKRASAHLAVSSLARDYLVSLGARREEVFLVLNSPDVDEISEKASQFRVNKEAWKKAKGLRDGAVALFVGRIEEEKGIKDLLSAYEIVLSRISSPNLVIVGRGRLLDYTRQYVREKGWNNVLVEGFVSPEKVIEYYGAADFLVLPSRHEPFGAVVHEALSAGLPVVASSAVGAIADLVVEKETGFVFEAGDVKALSELMIRLWDNPQLGESMRERCLKRAQMLDHVNGEEEFMKAVRTAVSNKKVRDE